MSTFLSVSSNSTRARLNLLEQTANSTRLNGSANGNGGLGMRGSGGASMFTPRSRMGTNIAGYNPFKITMTAQTGGLYYGTIQSGNILQSLRPNDSLSIIWPANTFPIIANDVIALYCPVSALVAVSGSAVIQSYGLGTTHFDPTLDAWDVGDDSYVFNDHASPVPSQIGLNILLAYTVALSSGAPYLFQCQTTDLLFENCNIDGYAAIYDFSHRTPYGLTPP